MRADILKKTKVFFVLSGVCLFFVPVFFSCGLEEYIYIQAPTVLNHAAPTYETEFADRYVAFETKENPNEQPNYDNFLGTAVYYKIYNNYNTMNSRINSIETLSTSTNESAAALQMIDNYGYKPLGLAENYSSPLVEKTGENRKVYIRLTNYYESQSNLNMAMVIVGNDDVGKFEQDASNLYDPVSNPGGYRIYGIPRRTGNRYTFDFGRNIPSSYENAENNVPPETEQNLGDYEESSSVSSASYETSYFVDLFAVGVGEDENFTQYYSNVLHLGSVTIDSESEHN